MPGLEGPVELAAGPEEAQEDDEKDGRGGVGPKSEGNDLRSGGGEKLQVFEETGEIGGGGDVASRNGSELGKDIELGGLADFFELLVLGKNDGAELGGVGAFAGEVGIDGPFAGLGDGEAGAEGAPGVVGFLGLELDAGRFSGGLGQFEGDGPFLEGGAVGIEDVGGEGDFVAGFGTLGGEVEADALVGGDVALVGHPARHLAPEAIVIKVFHPATPTPGGVVAEEEDLAASDPVSDEKGNAAVFVAAVGVDGENVGAGLGADDGGVPEEAGKGGPDGGVLVFAVGEHGEEGGAAFGCEFQGRGSRLGVSVGLLVV